MLFNSAEFIFAFLPVTLLCFFLIAKFFGNSPAIAWLVVASMFFYAWWNPAYLIIIVASMLINFYLGKKLYSEQKKSVLVLGIAINLGVLGYYKYTGFLVENFTLISGVEYSIHSIVLPLAISFFTFQQIAYLVDSWKRITQEYRFIHYALFVTFFPQLIAGPIVHHSEMLSQFRQNKTFQFQHSNIAIGLSIFAIGLFKKTVIADGMAVYANPVFNAADAGAAPDLFVAWSGALAYSFQLYFDFSGYSDMALGLARMFGIVLPLNFYSPYKATSIVEFWRRWHITLSRFLRDYVYIPLGGNRKGPGRRYLFLMTTMLLGGLWHGAGWNFVIWGGLHGLYLVVNHGWSTLNSTVIRVQIPKVFYWLLTMLAVIVGWVFFRATTLEGAVNVLQGMAGFNGVSLPNAILVHLGAIGELMREFGVGSYDGGATQLAQAWIGILIIMPVAVCLPNVQDIFRSVKASLSDIGTNLNNTYWPGYQTAQSLLWSPTRTWAVFLSMLLVISVMTLGRISDFLYFQF